MIKLIYRKTKQKRKGECDIVRKEGTMGEQCKIRYEFKGSMLI